MSWSASLKHWEHKTTWAPAEHVTCTIYMSWFPTTPIERLVEVGIFGKLPRSSFSTCAPPSHIVLLPPPFTACQTDGNFTSMRHGSQWLPSPLWWHGQWHCVDAGWWKIKDCRSARNLYGKLLWVELLFVFGCEVCLLLAHRLDLGDEKQSALVEEGLRLAGLAEAKMKDEEGNITNCTAFKSTNRIHSELRNFNNSNV